MVHLHIGGWRCFALLALLTLLFSAPLTSHGAPVADACADARVPPGVGVPRSTCRSAFVTYRDGGQSENASIAVVLIGVRDRVDPSGSKIPHDPIQIGSAFLLRSDRTLLHLGEQVEPYLPMLNDLDGHFGWPRRVAENALGIEASKAGGQCCFNPEYFSERWIEREGDRYCVAYRMRHPFTGTLRNCGEPKEKSGAVGYAPGIMTWREAVNVACRAVPDAIGRPSWSDSRHHCDYHGPFLATPIRDGDDSLAYIVAQSPPLNWNQRVYLLFRVEAADGTVTLVGRSNNRPDTRDAHAQRRP